MGALYVIFLSVALWGSSEPGVWGSLYCLPGSSWLRSECVCEALVFRGSEITAGSDLCGVPAVLSFLRQHAALPGPLFLIIVVLGPGSKVSEYVCVASWGNSAFSEILDNERSQIAHKPYDAIHNKAPIAQTDSHGSQNRIHKKYFQSLHMQRSRIMRST